MTWYNERMKNYIRINGLPSIKFAHKFAANKYTDTISSVPQGQTAIEVTYIFEGNLNFVFADGETVSAPPHSVVCNLRGENIKVHTDGFHEHHTVCFAVPVDVADARDEDALLVPFITHLPAGDNKILYLIDQIIHSYTVHTKGALANAGAFLQILDAIDRYNHTRVGNLTYASHRYIKKAKDYIFSHLNEPIHQTDIAAYLQISPEYLCHVFKSGEGIPIMQFINRVKLEQIHTLLENKGLTLSQASMLYGYTDPNYVSRLYKKYFQRNITDFKK